MTEAGIKGSSLSPANTTQLLLIPQATTHTAHGAPIHQLKPTYKLKLVKCTPIRLYPTCTLTHAHPHPLHIMHPTGTYPHQVWLVMKGTAVQVGLGLGTCGSSDLHLQEVVHPSHDLHMSRTGFVYNTGQVHTHRYLPAIGPSYQHSLCQRRYPRKPKPPPEGWSSSCAQTLLTRSQRGSGRSQAAWQEEKQEDRRWKPRTKILLTGFRKEGALWGASMVLANKLLQCQEPGQGLRTQRGLCAAANRVGLVQEDSHAMGTLKLNSN